MLQLQAPPCPNPTPRPAVLGDPTHSYTDGPSPPSLPLVPAQPSRVQMEASLLLHSHVPGHRCPGPRARPQGMAAGLPLTPGQAVPPARHSPTCRAADPTLSAFFWKAPEGASAAHPTGGNLTSSARRVERQWLLPDGGRLSSHQVPGICKVPSPLWCLCHSPR